MGRNVSIRENYGNDVSALLRLEKAIKEDKRYSQSWRDATNRLIREVSIRLLAPERTLLPVPILRQLTPVSNVTVLEKKKAI